MPKACSLVAVSKTKPTGHILAAYQAGVLDFGENKVQELVEKAEILPKDIRWHMIGHLQRNKVKYIAPFIHLIHGVDSLKLLSEINRQGEKCDRVIKCLLQVHIAKEESKFGFYENEMRDILKKEVLDTLPFTKIEGLMGMATHTDDTAQINEEFARLQTLFENLKKIKHEQIQLKTLSMGMSNDYLIALEKGSNMIRIGSAIFGGR